MYKDEQQRSETRNTRRIKRKVDDVEKASPASSRKRQAQKKTFSANKPTPSISTRRTTGSAKPKSVKVVRQALKKVVKSRTQSPKQVPATSNNALNGKEHERVTRLLKKANVDGNLLSMLEAQLQSNLPRSTDSDTAVDVRISHTLPSDTATKRDCARDAEDEDNEDEEEEKPGEFQMNQLADAENDDGSNNEECEDDVLNQDDERNAPNLGESEDEQEVSFNVECEKDFEVSDLGHGEQRDEPSNVPDSHTAPHGLSSQRMGQKLGGANSSGMLEGVDGIDDSVVLNIVGKLKRSISSAMNSSFDQILKEIRSDRESILKLREHVTELTSIITTTASAMFIKNPSSTPRTKEIHNKLCLLPALFSENFMLKVLPRVVTGFISTTINSGSACSDLEFKGIEFFSVLYFSKQPNEKKKEKFDSDIGRVYSKYRYGLLMSSFLAMQKNAFNTFRTDKIQNGAFDPNNIMEEEASTVGPSLSAILQPFWLKPGYVLSDHCTTAANKLERRGLSDSADDINHVGDSSQTHGDTQSIDMQEFSQSSGKQKLSRTGPLTQDEIATEAAGMVYKIITGTLYRSRYASKQQIYHDVLYVFSGWSHHTDIVDQATLRVQWEKPRERDLDYTTDLPHTKLVQTQDRRSKIGQEVDKSDLHNIAHLESVIAKHPELTLMIEHDVLVNGITTRLHYRVSLIEVACRALSAYITLESAAKGKHVLCADKRSLKAIVTLALGLRKLMEKAVDDLNSSPEVPWKYNSSNTKAKRGRPKRNCTHSASQAMQYKFEEVNGFILDHLQPPPSKQKEVLGQMILNLTQEEFNAKMDVNRRGTVNDNLGIAVFGNQGARIEADESQCVFGF